MTKMKEKIKNSIHFLKPRKSENTGIASLNSDGITHSCPVKKANILNHQFESVFSKPTPLNFCQNYQYLSRSQTKLISQIIKCLK